MHLDQFEERIGNAQGISPSCSVTFIAICCNIFLIRRFEGLKIRTEKKKHISHSLLNPIAWEKVTTLDYTSTVTENRCNNYSRLLRRAFLRFLVYFSALHTIIKHAGKETDICSF
jgi:hypothetical protein